MTPPVIWKVWTISKQEIDDTARSLGMNPAYLDDSDYDELAREFVRLFHNDQEYWPAKMVRTLIDLWLRKGGNPASRVGHTDNAKHEPQVGHAEGAK